MTARTILRVRPGVQRFNAAETCLKPAPWTAYPGVCTLPKVGHGKRCRFEAAEFIAVEREIG